MLFYLSMREGEVNYANMCRLYLIITGPLSMGGNTIASVHLLSVFPLLTFEPSDLYLLHVYGL